MPGVPGRGGVMPKRVAERMGHQTKAKIAEVDQVEMEGVVVVPAPRPEWHTVAKLWYNSLMESGQSRFFEPSDWAAAQYVAEAMHRNLAGTKFSGQLFGSVWAALNDLMTTEGARRRLKLELSRVPVAGEAGAAAAAASVLDAYRARIVA